MLLKHNSFLTVNFFFMLIWRLGKKTEFYKNSTNLTFCMCFGLEFQGEIHIQNLDPIWRRETDAQKKNLGFLEIFFLLWNETPHFWKKSDFHIMLDNFIVSVVISYCLLEVFSDFFQGVWKFWIEEYHILSVFGKMFLCQVIVDLGC